MSGADRAGVSRRCAPRGREQVREDSPRCPPHPPLPAVRASQERPLRPDPHDRPTRRRRKPRPRGRPCGRGAGAGSLRAARARVADGRTAQGHSGSRLPRRAAAPRDGKRRRRGRPSPGAAAGAGGGRRAAGPGRRAGGTRGQRAPAGECGPWGAAGAGAGRVGSEGCLGGSRAGSRAWGTCLSDLGQGCRWGCRCGVRPCAHAGGRRAERGVRGVDVVAREEGVGVCGEGLRPSP